MTAAPHEPISLRDVVQKYRELAGGFARPLALAAFGLSQQQTERVFGIFDEDYHISRFFHFSLQPAADGSAPGLSHQRLCPVARRSRRRNRVDPLGFSACF